VRIGNIKNGSKIMLAIGIMVLMVSLVTLKPTISFGNETNLVGFWQFEEGEGTVATDTSGKENNGTIVEPVWVTGKIGNALQFNGNSYVQIPHNAVLNPRNAITVEAWINPASNMQWRKIISKSLGGNTDYSFFQGDKSNIAFSIKMGSVARTVYGSANSLPLGEWTHVVGTYDGTRMRLYINGVQVNSIAISGQINCHAEPLRIGGEAGAYFQGQIDEVRVYNTALSAAEIRNRYEEANYAPAPMVLEAETTTDGKILITFDKEMASPPAAPAGFAVTVNGVQKAIKEVTLESNKAVLGLTMCQPILAVDTDIKVAYSAGNVKAVDGGILANFSDLSVLNRSTAPLLGRWQFNEGEGTIATDASGNGNNGSINGPVWTAGKVGNALLFNANGCVEIPHQEMLSPRNTLTVEAWINPENNMQWRKIISKSQGSNTDYSFFQGDKNNIAFSIKMGSIARTVYAPANTLPLGEWTYVVGTYDGTRMRLYINGVEENSIAISGQINYHAEPLRIGGEPGAYFKGMIDEVSIYNAALSATEILHNYEAAQVPPSPLVQQYTYDELNRLTEVLLPSGQKIQYQYDLGGNLTRVEVVE
jgi:YD repeat-containing protein